MTSASGAATLVDPSAVFRRLARDQWVRLHGTPRVSVLVGDSRVRAVWDAWVDLGVIDADCIDGDDLEVVVKPVVDRAIAAPTRAIAITTTPQALERWRRGRRDRLAAMIDEGTLLVEFIASGRDEGLVQPAASGTIGSAPPSCTRAAIHLDARSMAEAAMYEALEATPATQGRFALNESLSVRFGSRAAEVDLLSRGDRIAIEIDGVHHFGDLDRYRRDRRKDVLLQTSGLLVIRLLAEDVLRDPRESVRMVCEAMAYRQNEGSR